MENDTRKAYVAPTLSSQGTFWRLTLQGFDGNKTEVMEPELLEWAANT